MNKLQKAAAAHEGKFRTMMIRAADNARREMAFGKLRTALRKHDRAGVERQTYAAMQVLEKNISQFAPNLLMNALGSGANVAASSIPSNLRVARRAKRIDIAFDRTNFAAVNWVEQHGAELVVEITQETRRAIQDVIRRSFVDHIPPRQAALLIRQSVGLTQASANAVLKLRQTIIDSRGMRVYAGKTAIRVPEKGMLAGKLDSTLTAYAERLTKHRAMVIARTETMTASNEGQRQLWQEAVQQGILPKSIKRVWLVADPCPICRPFADAIAPLEGLFLGRLPNPPAHPQCKCTTGLA